MVGALPRWSGPDDQLAALETLERDYYAASTVSAVKAKLRTISRALAGWSLQPFPPSLDTIRALAATLKRGGYRSAASYLWLYKVESQRRGYGWPDTHQRALKDGIRSCERGLAPPHSGTGTPLPLAGAAPC